MTPLTDSQAKNVIKMLEAAGEQKLASTLRQHLAGRAAGISETELARLWLE
jgi:hypothetical protein